MGRGTKILINLGVNDVANVNAYAELVNKKAAEWTQKGATVYYASVNPVENGQYITKSMVNTFNKKLQARLSPQIHWIDSFSYLQGTGYTCLLYTSYWNQEQLLKVAREYKERKIPIDVIVCDFFHWPKMGDFRFDEEFFPDPEAMVKELKDMGIELMVSIWPQIDWKSENYEEMKQKGLLVKAEKGVDIAMLYNGNSTFYDAKMCIRDRIITVGISPWISSLV